MSLSKINGADGKFLNIIKEISAKDYMTFGMYLLQDENGAAVDLLKKNNIHDGAESVTRAIFQQWLASSTAAPHTYQHLIDCLRQSGLNALAELIVKN